MVIRGRRECTLHEVTLPPARSGRVCGDRVLERSPGRDSLCGLRWNRGSFAQMGVGELQTSMWTPELSALVPPKRRNSTGAQCSEVA